MSSLVNLEIMNTFVNNTAIFLFLSAKLVKLHLDNFVSVKIKYFLNNFFNEISSFHIR